MNIQSAINKLFKRDPNMEANKCFSQNGEDLILNRFLQNKPKGFYIDIGAHHPIRFSNTHLFYKKGWNGINIDAMPGSMKTFRILRKRDINIETGISSKRGNLTFYTFNEPALNTFDRDEAILKNKENFFLLNTLSVKVDRLDNILEKYLNHNQDIDFMNIDVEGKEEEVLLSNNWEKYRPKFILIEILHKKVYTHQDCKIKNYLNQKGYFLINKAYDTCIFEKDLS